MDKIRKNSKIPKKLNISQRQDKSPIVRRIFINFFSFSQRREQNLETFGNKFFTVPFGCFCGIKKKKKKALYDYTLTRLTLQVNLDAHMFWCGLHTHSTCPSYVLGKKTPQSIRAFRYWWTRTQVKLPQSKGILTTDHTDG